jgi:Tfp pilus assembly protein PilO
MIWREKRILLLILAVLLAANTLFFFTYRVRYQNRLDDLDARLEAAETKLEQARAQRARAEASLRGYRQVERDVVEVFDEHWSTEPRRFTALLTEVKRLAVASSLVPSAITFTRGEMQRVNTGKRRDTLGANEVMISFSVNGSYAQVRRLINLFELSQQFVIINSISLAAAEGNSLTLNLQLKTLFREAPAATAATESNRL